jgi:hypothetical protein
MVTAILELLRVPAIVKKGFILASFCFGSDIANVDSVTRVAGTFLLLGVECGLHLQ